mgnify:CR=1 FL=1
MANTITTYQNPIVKMTRPGLLGRAVFDDVLSNFWDNGAFSTMLAKSTQGYPVADIYRNGDGDTVMEFALAGFSRSELSIEVKPEKKSITVRASSDSENDSNRRIARRSFEKTYVNYDNNLDLAASTAEFENGLLRVVVPTRPEAKPVTVKIK